ncbi:MAG: EAL domain-containing protein [Clostridiaceae bacterium]|nr:EAL domain-containing protein [Clostridiaceae bacterium]
MPSLNTILIVEDDCANRKLLHKILSDEYSVLEARNGQEGIKLLSRNHHSIAAVILGLVMPVIDGFAFLQAVYGMADYKDLPIISTGDDNPEHEKLALKLGAWDFVSTPYNPDILKIRLRHAIERSQRSALKRLQYLAEYDTLTDIYNKSKFLSNTKKMLNENPDTPFVFIRFDVNRFQLINSFYGIAEGDKCLKFVAEKLREYMGIRKVSTYGRMEADVFACCCTYSTHESVNQMLQSATRVMQAYRVDFNIVPTFGVYYLDDYTLPVELMLDRATLAAKSCKGSYIANIAEYTPEMSRKLAQEQEISGEMQGALESGQFCFYLQPKYSLITNKPCGAEALVRWNHPEKGMISPSSFIPVFEKNGFVGKIDYFVWEQVCRLLSGWIHEGKSPMPISVNMSRVNFYNPKIVDMICELTERYEVPPRLLQLELTESAYMDDPHTMKVVVHQLKIKGFPVHMDDFGSGYSSLSILKDIEVDVLKIDMHFLEKSEIAGRGNNIIASIVRMAKWLNIPTVAEGAENSGQVEFLRSIGCEYAQGYYFARPMTVEEYERLMDEKAPVTVEKKPTIDMDALWASNPQMEILFSDSVQASCILEMDNGTPRILRANRAFNELLSVSGTEIYDIDIERVMLEFRTDLKAAFNKCIDSRGFTECDFRHRKMCDRTIWINVKFKYISQIGNMHILFCSLFDITAQKNIEAELKRYQYAVLNGYSITNKLLVVDDQLINRTVLRSIFKAQYTVLEAANGDEAIRILAENGNRVDLILLDIMMPVMDGLAFLEYKKTHQEIADIPIIMITSADAPEQQINTLSMGANDYIIKPFVPEIVRRRVENVLEATYRLREIVREYENAMAAAQSDPLTQLYNRQAAERIISLTLSAQTGQTHALVMLDIDNFKQANDNHGHSFGDEVLSKFAEKLRQYFRKKDIIARLGGDEFCVFLTNIPSGQFVVKKCRDLIQQLGAITFANEFSRATCSAGIALTSSEATSFETLYKRADNALYRSKRSGKNSVSIYGMEPDPAMAPTAEQLITDAAAVAADSPLSGDYDNN